MIFKYGLPYHYTHFAEPHVEKEEEWITIENDANVLKPGQMFRTDLSSFDNMYAAPIADNL